MAAKTDAQLARLRATRADASAPQAVAEIESALRGKSTVVAARAAEIVAEAKLDSLEPALLEAFDRFMQDGTDKGCIAKLAIAKALLELETRAELTMLRGARHVQMEPAYPRAADVAAELRANCAVALVNMRSRRAINVWCITWPTPSRSSVLRRCERWRHTAATRRKRWCDTRCWSAMRTSP